MECLIAAVRNGADAVYFGGGAFNARRGAKNFTGDELGEAIDFCRLRKVRTNVTLNTLLFGRELGDALLFAEKLLMLRADAVIVQDLGLAALIRRELPELAVHASTQMGIHDIGGLRYCEENGFTRAVLAREVPLEEIRRMHEKSPIELEFFCHGALCMGFSGSCLYSSMAGERSGNRGTCAQPCRKNASVLGPRAGKDEFALSTNDIAMIDELSALREAGICSFKIEGRMKSPEYVAAVTRIYRAALDGEKPKNARRTLFSIFNRGEFSSAHLYGDSVTTGHVGSAKPDRELIAAAHESVRNDRPAWELAARLEINTDSPARLTFETEGYSAEAVGPVCEIPNRPVDKKRLAEQLEKLGGTPFAIGSSDIRGEGFIPVSALNSMRREAAEGLSRAILERGAIPARVDENSVRSFIKPVGECESAPLRYVRVRTAEEALRANADWTGIDPVSAKELDTEALKGVKGELILILPNVLMTEDARAAYEKLLKSGAFSGVEANNIGQWKTGENLPIRIAGLGMNAMNPAAFTKLLDTGFTHIMPSCELSKPQLADLSKRYGGVMIVNTYHRAELMQLMHCPVKEYKGCQNCRGDAGMLADGEGRRFPLENVRFKGYCLVRLKNSAVTDIREEFAESGMRVFGTAETADKEKNAPVTRGHFHRNVI